MAWQPGTSIQDSPISPPGCPAGGLGNLYLLYILPHFTSSAFLLLRLFSCTKYSSVVLGVNYGSDFFRSEVVAEVVFIVAAKVSMC